jgi:hypothetical protein
MDLVGFTITKFVKMHGHTNVKFHYNLLVPINAHSEIRGAVKKFPELWYSALMVGHMTTLT